MLRPRVLMFKNEEAVMAKSEPEISVFFAGLKASDEAPKAALYMVGSDGRPDKKLGSIVDGTLRLEGSPPKGAQVVIAPDVKKPKTIDPESLLRYRFDDVIEIWRERGLFIPEDRWTLLLSEIVCVSGRVRKCRPWWLDIVDLPFTSIATTAKLQSASLASDFTSTLFPRWCVPLCDGKVEVWERNCCCHHPWLDIDSLLDRLRDLLERVPIEIDWPVPPEPEPWGPLFERIGPVALNPQPLPPVARPMSSPRSVFHQRLHLQAVGTRLKAASKDFDPGHTYVSERIFEDYKALVAMPRTGAQAFIEARPYLYAYFCHCTMKKVGEVAIQPDGEFDFCYWRPRQFHHLHHHCHTTYAYRVKQLINGVWTTVYDGVAGQDYYGQGERAELTTTSPKARPCAAGPKPPHEGDGTPFVILQNVTGGGTNHFNFPTQTDVSRVAPLSANSGLYNWSETDVSLKDCPWATTLGLRLWSSPLLKDVVVYYRLKVAKVGSTGLPISPFQTLTAPVSWQRYDGTQKATEGLAALPSDVGGQEGLFKFPYEGDGKNWFWVDYHQNWNTAAFDPDGSDPAETIEDGKFMVVLEVFGPGGVRIKPNDAAGPGVERAFQFRRWINSVDTANVPFADCAHVFWVNNKATVANIEDLRNNLAPNTGECQFMSGNAASTFSIGFRAYHAHGVTTGGGPSDTNSFLRAYGISWQRGLNGPSGGLESGIIDQGETAIEPSNSLTFGYLLGPFIVDGVQSGPHNKCTFSVHLAAHGKHHNGGGFLDGYFSRYETASFALDINS
jgi:hypothetical protein